ncbi:MAG: heme lyase CcmF/NrfE family subunit [Pseudomonadota bacterium]
MLAEIGNFTLILAFLVALYQSAIPLAGALKSDAALTATGRPAALAQGALIVLAFVCLTILHATSDFSVANVVQNSHSAKPFIYKLTGVWGNHEGSMLLWVLILAAFGAAVAVRRINQLSTLTLAVQGMVAAAFLAFILFTSNPFARVLPAPADGMDLNPLLQDPGLIIHPPFLYLGYVGFSITFAYAVAGLIRGRIDREWARAVHPFALAAWVFLTIGIALGSWWAYYELGWGGFWAWDPVENASFMPWLAGTAFIHSVRVVEKRGVLKVWTVLLAILAFSLSLVGTFLVRSGILTSVHAFAVDPERGVFILAILAAVVGGSLTLFALRANTLEGEGAFRPVSREGALLFNNVLLVAACVTVFIGTFYPLFIDIVSGERLSVGAPYFNAVFAPFTVLLLLAMAPGAMLAWKKGDLNAALRQAAPAAGVGVVLLLVALSVTWPRAAAGAIGAALAAWAAGGAVLDMAARIKLFRGGASQSLSRLAGLPRSYLGMTVAHIGLGVVIVGVMGAGVWRTERVQLMSLNDAIPAGAYEARLIAVEDVQGPNYVAQAARFQIEKNGVRIRELTAERRFYPVRGMQTTEAAIWTTLRGDLYVTLGEQADAQGWAVRAFYNPFAVWMWIGAGLLGLGGIIAAAPNPARRAVGAPAPSRAPEAAAS